MKTRASCAFDLDYATYSNEVRTERVYLKKHPPDDLDDHVTYQVCRLADDKALGNAEALKEDAIRSAQWQLRYATFPKETYNG